MTSSLRSSASTIFLRTDGRRCHGLTLFHVIATFMEDYEEVALSRAASRPTYSFRYVEEIFVIWLHGPKEPYKSP